MAKTESAQVLEAYQEVIAASAKGQQALLAPDQGSLYHDVMQESYKTLLSIAPPLQLQQGFPIQKSELLACLNQGQQAWTPEAQNSNKDTEENPVTLQLTGWPEPGKWWNSYRSPISVPSSDSSGSDNESSSEKEEEKTVKQECLKITKPRAALLGKCEVKQEGCEPWQSERLGQLQGSMRMPLCWTREKDRGLIKSRKGKRGADPGKNLFVCPQCGNTFNRKSSLKRHLTTIHDEAKLYEWPPHKKSFLEKTNRGTRGRRHTRTPHSGREPYECPECGESFMTSASFTQHRRSHTGETTYQCPACDRSYTEERYLIKHLMTAHAGAHLSNCPDCGKSFLGEEDLSMHQAMVHGGESFHQCLDCGKCYREKLSLIRHQTLHKKKATCKCPDCGMSFADRRKLANHLLTHKNQKPHKYLDQEGSGTEEYVYTCPDCGKCFKTERCFVNHQRIHRKEQQCQQPDKGDILKGGAQNHETHVEMQRGAESAGGKPFGAGLTQPKVDMEETLHTCLDCGKSFKDSQCFANHQNTHITGETSDNADSQGMVEERKLPHAGQQEGQMKGNPYQCYSCGKTYATQYNLNRHQRIHADSRPYKCTICGKTFTYRYTLIHHEATHTEGKTCLHKCSYCGKGFTTKMSLSRHLQLHVMGRPYQCGVCGKAFAYRYSLTHHQETHVEGQAQKCLFCHKVFRTNHSLNRHKRIHMETRSFQCSVCGKAFGTKYSFCRHQDRHLNGSLKRSPSSEKDLVDSSALAKDQASDTDENSNNWSDNSTLSEHHRGENSAECSKSADGSLPAKCQSVLVKEYSSKGLDVQESLAEFSARVDSDILTKRQNTHLREHSVKGLDGGETSRDLSGVTKDQGSHKEQNVHEGTYNLANPRQHGACTEDSLPESSEKREHFAPSLTLIKHQNIPIGVSSIPGLNNDQRYKDSLTRSGFQGVSAGQQKHVCSHCGKSCRDSYSLKRHERTHTSERPYQCQKCGKRFRETKNLIRHQTTHSDLRPYPCTECGKHFKSKTNLDKHQNVHKKPFSCPHCDKRVTTSSILKNHLRTHTGERPFKCTECDKDYKTKAALNKHREGHFKENSSEAPKVDQSNQIF
ncbi:zinc finger protein 595-like [Heteronotia binoei]|uniref:zinc finger protein 595-like n=1 Tax=Heteronotia binoei TaxID=13085 RepID=UPI00292E9B0C|nr:zinc finger protein 595-like [Heteronotia binoei]XP_060095294.1 zinc finger protein 595-like [Heteronotia binoei]XP_060095295.1 zinc finger protein 595-like [Heteronotia binoei]